MSVRKINPMLQVGLQEEQKENQKIKQKYGIDMEKEPDGVIVVEKITVFDKLIKICRWILHVLVFIGFFIGVVCLITPSIRAVLWMELEGFLETYLSFLTG